MFKLRSAIAFSSIILTSIFASGLSAQATPAPTLTISNTGTSLAGTSVSNFDPSLVLDLTFSIDAGKIRIELGDSGAVLTPGLSLYGQLIGITGTQEQLNAALDSATVFKGCDSARTIIGSVTPSNGYKYNATNGHWYYLVAEDTSWDAARAAAKTRTVPLGVGNGYLANVTTSQENNFIKLNFGGSPLLGGSDSALEGDWYWMDGPEAGTKFYSNGAAINNAFTSFGKGEPNNYETENFLQTGGGSWNDINNFGFSYLVEFGGMPGDDFSSIPLATRSTTITLPALSGAGTSLNPYLVSNQADFEALNQCGSSKYYQQTADIETDLTFKGLESFSGHFDGKDYSIDLSASTTMLNPLFGNVQGSTLATDASISNLTVTGAHMSFRSALAGTVSFATIDNVHVASSSVTGADSLGLLAQSIEDSVVRNTGVSGNVNLRHYDFGAGGLAGATSRTQYKNVTCDVQLSTGNLPFMMMMSAIGGCIGESNNSSFEGVTSSGSFTLPSNLTVMDMIDGVGGLIGRTDTDTILDSSSAFTVDTSAVTNSGPLFQIGGLVGQARSTSISRSFATGAINAPSSVTSGGLVGDMYQSTILNSYATGSVTAYFLAGSLVGNMASSTVTNSYATGVVLADQPDSSHGLIGNSDNHSVTNSFWKINSTGVPSSTESVGAEVPKFSGELKKLSTFSDWNISTTPSSSHDWAICPSANGGYPYLAWQTVSSGCSRSFTSGASAVITGIAYVGGTVAALPVGWDPLAVLSFQWFNGSNPIAQATSAQFTPAPGDAGKMLSVKVTGSKSGYVPSVVSTASVKIAAAPTTKLTVLGGFAKNSKVVSKNTKLAITSLLKNVGKVITVKCDAFITGKKLTATQKKLATARASAVCALIRSTTAPLSTVLKTSIAKKSDKISEGVRVTIVSVKP